MVFPSAGIRVHRRGLLAIDFAYEVPCNRRSRMPGKFLQNAPVGGIARPSGLFRFRVIHFTGRMPHLFSCCIVDYGYFELSTYEPLGSFLLFKV